MRSVQALAVAVLLLLPACDVAAGEAKQGGILRVYHRDSPGSASIHEGATYSINIPFMPGFNNLVVFKQDVAQHSVDSIVPDPATSRRARCALTRSAPARSNSSSSRPTSRSS